MTTLGSSSSTVRAGVGDIFDEYEERLEELAGGDDPASLTGPRAEALRMLQQEEIEVFGQPVSG